MYCPLKPQVNQEFLNFDLHITFIDTTYVQLYTVLKSAKFQENYHFCSGLYIFNKWHVICVTNKTNEHFGSPFLYPRCFCMIDNTSISGANLLK